MVEETGHHEALDATQLADGETLVQTAGGTILDDDPAVTVDRGAAIGRYTVLERLGSGAMGVVYTAYDPKLDRRVALKLLRIPREDSGSVMVARLIREAQALAKLSHPNVVAIHDCDTVGDHVYLAMELVEGTTLKRWLRGARSPAEILERFVQAGRGLAAAHRVGLVHRDFKPDNVLLGDDGRVRVADFGIARNADEDPLAGPSRIAERVADFAFEDTESGAARLTQTGAVVGTPAYMSPEQHVGVRVDARCDQFAFCVALFEALYRAHPFPSSSYLELRRRVLAGEVAPVPGRSDVPAKVRAAILRGLHVYPDKRFATMEALLEELEYDPHRRRRRLVNVGLLAGLVAVIAASTSYAVSSARAACEDAERHLAGVWDDEIRGAAELAFAATGRPYAEKAWESSAAALDRYAGAWVTMRREACEATAVYHEQSPELLDLRMACLDRQLRSLSATADLLHDADSEIVLRAVGLAEALPALDACADTEALVRSEAPVSEAERRRHDQLDQLIAEADALGSAGRYEAALARADQALALARGLDDRALARALHAKATATDQLGRSSDAAQLLDEAARLAERAGADLLRGEIWSELGLVEALALERHGEAERRLRHTAAIYERGGAPPLARAQLESRLGAVLSASGRYDEALATLDAALVELRALPGDQSMVILSTLNTLGLTHDLRGDYEAALALDREALALAEDRVGSDHPESAKLLNNIAIIEKTLGDHEAARRDYLQALAIYRRAYEPEHPTIGATLCNLGNLYLAMGRYEEAIRHYDEALGIYERTLSADSELIARIHYNVGVSHHLDKRYDDAVASYRKALTSGESIYAPDHPELAYPLAGLGSALVELMRYTEALDPLERALAIRSRKDVPPVDIGEIRFALARALPIDGRPRALELARAAAVDYAELGDQATVDRINAWLSEQAAEDPE
ncbi:MAG: serine/threonine-protein kinase [Nannocystaceae bacterium]